MSAAPQVEQAPDEAARRLAERELLRREAKAHPRELLRHVRAVDAKAGKHFRFDVDDERGWGWQFEVIEWWLANLRTIILKARQLGVTWLACGLALWIILTQPGTTVLAVSIKEAEAIKLICRVWDMYLSLPVWMRYDVKVLKPAKGHRPTEKIELEHPDGRISTMLALASSRTAGHGETAALVILDEDARQEYADETWKAVVPTAADADDEVQPRIVVISTANGVSNEKTGAGNHFHHLWINADAYGLATKFLGWRTHPGRGDDFLDGLPLSDADKREQYPDNPSEAFRVSGHRYFDSDALEHYRTFALREPVFRGRFTLKEGTRATAILNVEGRTADTFDPGNIISFFIEPAAGHEYAIACDPATGSGFDSAGAYVIDLATMELVAQLHGQMDQDVLAAQLHYLGRYYNTAIIAIENQGGYGAAVIILLRDGKAGRPAYRRLYRFRDEITTDLKERRNYGYPVTAATRNMMLGGMAASVREKSLPFVTVELLHEMDTFVHKQTNPSPRADDGQNDDLIFAAAGALDIYRRFAAPVRRKRERARKPKKLYPWDPEPVARK